MAGCALYLFVQKAEGNYAQVFGKQGDVGTLKRFAVLKEITKDHFNVQVAWSDGKGHTNYRWNGRLARRVSTKSNLTGDPTYQARRGSARTVSRKTTAASHIQARTRSLLDMWGFLAKVVTEADGRSVGYILSLRIHGVAETCLEERVARLREVPFGTEDGVPGFEVGVDKGTEIARNIVIKAEDGCECPELQSGIELDSIGGEPHGYRFRARCRVGNERSAVSILTVWEAKPSSTFVSVFTCEFAENTKVMQRTPSPDRLPGMHGQPLREIMFDSPSM